MAFSVATNYEKATLSQRPSRTTEPFSLTLCHLFAPGFPELGANCVRDGKQTDLGEKFERDVQRRGNLFDELPDIDNHPLPLFRLEPLGAVECSQARLPPRDSTPGILDVHGGAIPHFDFE